jgi:hypothetical protein
MGPEIISLLERNKSVIGMEHLVELGGPVIMFSPTPETDAENFKAMLGLSFEVKNTLADQLFNCVILKRNSIPTAIIFKEEACIGYTLVTVKGKGDMRVGTPDALLHLYYSLVIFGTKEKTFFKTSLDCLIQKIFTIAERARSNPSKFVPAFSLRCSGQQKGMATLLKEKAERTKEEKKKVKGTKKVSKTKSSSKKQSVKNTKSKV